MCLIDDKVLELLSGQDWVRNEYMVQKSSKYDYRFAIKLPLIEESKVEKIARLIGVDTVGINGTPVQKLRKIIQLTSSDSHKMRDILRYIFGKENFKSYFDDRHISLSIEKIKKIRSEICEGVINTINVRLYFNDYQIVIKSDGPDLIPIADDWKNDLIIGVSNADNISKFQVQSSYEKLKKDIQNGDKTGAITQSRTLLEGVLKYSRDKKGVEITDKEKIRDLIKKFEKLYIESTVQDSDLKEKIKQLIGNLTGTAQAIGSFRNKFSDAHANSRADKLIDTYAYFVINSTFSLSNFILGMCENKL